jgi:hypothetical protein
MGILQGIQIHDIMCEGMVKNKKIQGYVGWWKRVKCKEKTNRFSRLVERVFANIPLFHKHNTLKILIKSDVGKLEHNMLHLRSSYSFIGCNVTWSILWTKWNISTP